MFDLPGSHFFVSCAPEASVITPRQRLHPLGHN